MIRVIRLLIAIMAVDTRVPETGVGACSCPCCPTGVGNCDVWPQFSPNFDQQFSPHFNLTSSSKNECQFNWGTIIYVVFLDVGSASLTLYFFTLERDAFILLYTFCWRNFGNAQNYEVPLTDDCPRRRKFLPAPLYRHHSVVMATVYVVLTLVSVVLIMIKHWERNKNDNKF
jgi:hypothetical protein